ncbi:uncharacterized protein [Physcomitrium patens]|uniref:Uncharacterized protein n=1 Tax=Physcomitrium patens TaxID=3218 RepID=A0A2K1K7Z3_PHYPA|nr:uncharacterized protein LOC112285977 [Physcomitrium patens]PNR49897.1 hypothetical protein PHYPA_011794 [Physcomitrium patens]|eukprot:XP_024383177.1 uncharacterized protein LOC112285977 [Physcomitrella patens]
MCPLRVILLFLSAILAGYFAFKTVREQGNSSILSVDEDEPEQAMEQTSIATKVTTGISSSFWVVIDMLSGRYLYQNLKGQTQAKGEELAS